VGQAISSDVSVVYLNLSASRWFSSNGRISEKKSFFEVRFHAGQLVFRSAYQLSCHQLSPPAEK